MGGDGVIEIIPEEGYSNQMKIKYVLDDDAYPLSKAHEQDAGFDLRAMEDHYIYHLDGECIDTGVHIEIPEGYEASVRGRSGLNINHDIICPVGTVDSGYTGSIRVKLYNMGTETYHVHRGDKIAQLVISPIAKCELVELASVENLADTERGSNGFGSSGR